MPNEVIKIHFHITKESAEALTWEDLDILEMARNGEVTNRQIRSLLARFMVDDDLKILPHDKATKLLGKVSVSQIKDVMQQFTEVLAGAAVPNGNGRPSNSPTEAPSAETSQAGVVILQQP